MNLSDLSEDERAVYLAAFGAFVGQLTLADMGADRIEAAEARGMKAVRWLRESTRKQRLAEYALAYPEQDIG